jgi:hypothetical protein
MEIAEDRGPHSAGERTPSALAGEHGVPARGPTLSGLLPDPGLHAQGLQMHPDALSARLRRNRAADHSAPSP